jgi:hypothetical protein
MKVWIEKFKDELLSGHERLEERGCVVPVVRDLLLLLSILMDKNVTMEIVGQNRRLNEKRYFAGDMTRGKQKK